MGALQWDVWSATNIATLIVALISLASSVILARLAFRNSKRLAEFQAKLEDQKGEAGAKRQYEYDARKRLYAECYPVIFQLSEYADLAYRRVLNIADAAVAGGLRERLGNQYYSSSTMYRIIAPAACFVLMRQRLTAVDLSLDERINRLYKIARLHYSVLLADFEMSAEDPTITYKPHEPEAETHRNLDPRQPNPAEYWYQALVWGYLDRAASSMLVSNNGGAEQRIMGFGEFDDAVRKDGSQLNLYFKPIRDLFEDFTPNGRPTLWRVFAGLAILTRMFRADAAKADIGMLMFPKDAERIRKAAGAEVGDPLEAAAGWITKQLAPVDHIAR